MPGARRRLLALGACASALSGTSGFIAPSSGLLVDVGARAGTAAGRCSRWVWFGQNRFQIIGLETSCGTRSSCDVPAHRSPGVTATAAVLAGRRGGIAGVV